MATNDRSGLATSGPLDANLVTVSGGEGLVTDAYGQIQALSAPTFGAIGATITLTAQGVFNYGGNVSVSFYADTNNNGILDAGDTLLGTATSEHGNPPSLTFSSDLVGTGNTTFFAKSNLGGNVASAQTQVGIEGAIQGVSVTATNGGDDLQIAPEGLFTAGGTTGVSYYLDTNQNGSIDPGTDTLLGTAGPGANWAISVPVASLPTGGFVVLAQSYSSSGPQGIPVAAPPVNLNLYFVNLPGKTMTATKASADTDSGKADYKNQNIKVVMAQSVEDAIFKAVKFEADNTTTGQHYDSTVPAQRGAFAYNSTFSFQFRVGDLGYTVGGNNGPFPRGAVVSFRDLGPLAGNLPDDAYVGVTAALLTGDLGIIKADGNEIPDSQELSPGGFVPVHVTGQSDYVPLRLHQISPTGAGGNYTLTFDSSHIRLWLNSNGTGPVTSGQSFNAATQKMVYVEGVSVSDSAAAEKVTLKWYGPGGSANSATELDKVALTVVAGDLDIVEPTGTEIPEAQETSPGGFVTVHTDGGSNDTQLVLRPVQPSTASGTYTLTFSGSNIRLWKDSAHTDAVVSGTTQFAAGSAITVYVQGVTPSTTVGQETIMLKWSASQYSPGVGGGSPTPNAFLIDSVSLTVINLQGDVPYDISADSHEGFVAAMVGVVNDDALLTEVAGLPVTFNIFRNDLPIATQTANISNGAAAIAVTTSNTPGDRYRVVAEFLGSTTVTDDMVVVPGQPSEITHQLSKQSYASDGTDTITITATIRDQFGNLVADGTPVSLLLDDPSSHFAAAGTSTIVETVDGVVQITVVAPEVPGQQNIIIRAGGASDTVSIDAPQVVASLSGPAVLDLATGQSGTVTLATNAADGTKVFWTISNGDIRTLETTVSGGTSSIPIQATGTWGRVGPCVVTATISSAMTYTVVTFQSTAPLYLELDRFVISGDVTDDGEETITYPGVQPLSFAPQVVPDRTVTVPYYAHTNVAIHGTPGATYLVNFADSTSYLIAAIDGLDSVGRITLDASGVGIVQLRSLGVLNGNPLTPQFADVTLIAELVDALNPFVADPNGPTAVVTVKYVQHSWWTRTTDGVASFFGGDPETGVGVASNVAGGMLIVGDVGSIAKNGWRFAGFSDKEPNYVEVGLSGLGLATELAVGAGELADAPISGVRALVAGLGNLPAGKILPILYRRFLTNASDMAQFVRFIARVTDETAFQVLKNVLTSEDVMVAAMKAADDFGDAFFKGIKQVSSQAASGGVEVAQRITKLLGDLPGNARQFFKDLSPNDLETAIDHLGFILAPNKIDAALLEKLLTYDDLFTASYTRLSFLADLRLVADAEGVEKLSKYILSSVANFREGRLYELQAAAKIFRDGGEMASIEFISKYVKGGNGLGATDIDFIIGGVYYQAKRGWGGATVPKTRAWIAKAEADGATTIKYITPPGTIPDDIAALLKQRDITVIPFAIP